MRAGLDASTVTPGSTAPVESRTTPEIVACARAIVGTISAINAPTATLTTCFRIPPSRAYERVTTLAVTDVALIALPALLPGSPSVDQKRIKIAAEASTYGR